MRDEKSALSLLGIALRAGQVISGDDLCERAVRKGSVALVLLDCGASGNTKDKYAGACGAREIPLCLISEGALGHAIGRDNRMVAAVRKGSLAEKVRALLE